MWFWVSGHRSKKGFKLKLVLKSVEESWTKEGLGTSPLCYRSMKRLPSFTEQRKMGAHHREPHSPHRVKQGLVSGGLCDKRFLT